MPTKILTFWKSRSLFFLKSYNKILGEDDLHTRPTYDGSGTEVSKL